MLKPPYTTSARLAVWKAQCEVLLRLKEPFEVRDVTTKDHETFVYALSARHDRKFTQDGTTFYFAGGRLADS
jgi:hypothetical protein